MTHTEEKKSRHLLTIPELTRREYYAGLFMQALIIAYQGMPEEVTTDRDGRVISEELNHAEIERWADDAIIAAEILIHQSDYPEHKEP